MQIILFQVNPDDLIPFGFVVHKVVLGWVLLGVLQFSISIIHQYSILQLHLH